MEQVFQGGRSFLVLFSSCLFGFGFVGVFRRVTFAGVNEAPPLPFVNPQGSFGALRLFTGYSAGSFPQDPLAARFLPSKVPPRFLNFKFCRSVVRPLGPVAGRNFSIRRNPPPALPFAVLLFPRVLLPVHSFQSY